MLRASRRLYSGAANPVSNSGRKRFAKDSTPKFEEQRFPDARAYFFGALDCVLISHTVALWRAVFILNANR